MHSQILPGCCGVVVCCDHLENSCLPFDEALSKELATWWARGLVLYTTISTQTNAINVLTARGFEVLTTFLNPQTDRTVTVWGLKINQ